MTTTTIGIRERAEALGPWYHPLELAPGYTTTSYMVGWLESTWAMIRKVTSSVVYEDRSVLDLGAMDGMWSFEAEKRKASVVVAGDIWQNAGQSTEKWPWNRPRNGIDRFLFAREVLGSKAVPVTNAEVQCLHERMASVMRMLDLVRFDIVQCFGLLYHVQNPLLALHQIRRCLSSDGVLILETACWTGGGDAPCCRLNRFPAIYDDMGSYWFPNRAALVQILTLAGFNVGKMTSVSQAPKEAERICVICPATLVPHTEDNYGSQ